MARSIQQLFQDKVDWKDVGNVAKRRALRAMYDQNYQQQVAQATAMNPSGLPMGTASGQYTVTSNDTLSTIANANGTTETDLLNANPDVKQLQTGMVINTPRPPSGGVGLPSAGPLGVGPGGLSTYQDSERTQTPISNNPYGPQFKEGMLALSNARSQQSRAIPQRFTNPSTGFTNFGNPFSQSQYTPSVNPVPYQGSIASTAMAIGGNYGLLGQPQTPTTPQTPKTPGQSLPYYGRPISSTDRILMNVAFGDKTPSDAEVKQLVDKGIILPPTNATGLNGNYSYGNIRRKPKGRGGGGGAARLPAQRGGVGQGERLPAFSRGAGFGGLVNWRI